MSVGNSNLTGIPNRVVPPKANPGKPAEQANSPARQAAQAVKTSPNAPTAPQAPTVAAAVNISGTVSGAPSSGATTVGGKGNPAQSQGQIPTVTAAALATSGVLFAQISGAAMMVSGKKATDVSGDKTETEGVELVTEAEAKGDKALSDSDSASAHEKDGGSAAHSTGGPAT